MGFVGLAPLTESQTCQEVRSPQWHTKASSSTPSDEVRLGSGTINQAANVYQARVGVADIQLVIPELSREPTGHVGFQVSDVPLII